MQYAIVNGQVVYERFDHVPMPEIADAEYVFAPDDLAGWFKDADGGLGMDPRGGMDAETLARLEEYNMSKQTNPRVLTRVQFLSRLTPVEWAAAVTSIVPEVLYFVELVRAAQEIDLDDPQTQAGLHVAVQAGVLTEARAGEVLG